MSDRQISTITALTSLECLDLTGVQLPVSTLRTFACLTSLTQLRIPNVTVCISTTLCFPEPIISCPSLHSGAYFRIVAVHRQSLLQIVSERFLQLMGEGRDAPRLAEMLEAMPQLRHLDLYCVQHGENQTSLKDPKHMRTLARATQLQYVPHQHVFTCVSWYSALSCPAFGSAVMQMQQSIAHISVLRETRVLTAVFMKMQTA